MPFLSEILAYITANFSIISFFFYFCLALFVIVYYTIGKKLKIQWILLLGASLFFYLANGLKVSLWIFIPITVTYSTSLAVGKLAGRKKSLLTAFTILFNILFLIYFKEMNFFVRLINRILSLVNYPLYDEVSRQAPFGISYLTLMLISYYLDVSWQTTTVQKNPFRFLTYILFFPITSSGPITRYSQLKENLFESHSFDYERFCFGCQRILWGFFKKLIIAERIAIIVNNVYSNNEATGFVVLIGLLSFSFQMYFDFSGCMDMVMGIGQVLGIELPENFKQPFYSTSLSEFWRRWHITLGFWVKDYVLYIVLKSRIVQNLSDFLKKRLGKKNRYTKLISNWCGMFCTWFVVGFWHSGEWKYILGSGLFFFAMIAMGQILKPVFEKLILFFHINVEHYLWIFFKRCRTLFLFSVSVSFDRAKRVSHALDLWHRAFTNFFHYYPDILFVGIENNIIWLIALILTEIFFIERYEYLKEDNQFMLKAVAKLNIIFRWIIYYSIIYAILFLGTYNTSFNAADFIYMGF